jgi:hypothetical protein
MDGKLAITFVAKRQSLGDNVGQRFCRACGRLSSSNPPCPLRYNGFRDRPSHIAPISSHRSRFPRVGK